MGDPRAALLHETLRLQTISSNLLSVNYLQGPAPHYQVKGAGPCSLPLVGGT
jgi:hypothetical protein